MVSPAWEAMPYLHHAGARPTLCLYWLGSGTPQHVATFTDVDAGRQIVHELNETGFRLRQDQF